MKLLHRSLVRLAIAVSALVLSRCGSPPITPTPPPVAQLVLSCPPAVKLENVVGANQVVSFAAPTSTGGVPPISVTCTPASGSSFPLGNTTVTCRGLDAAVPAQPASCTLDVTLVPYVPILSLTRFMAFGDSITDGELNDDIGGCVHPTAFARSRDLASLFSVQRTMSYPADLQRLLAEWYVTQTITVDNQGRGAESTSTGLSRFAAVVRATRPEGVLLLQGVIDLADTWPGLGGISTIIRNLETDINEARANGAKAVFLGTLLPTIPTFRGCYVTSEQIQALNAAIRSLASRTSSYLVDSYAVFAGRETTLIGPDGLHPNAQGYQALAQAFFAVIKDKLEDVPK